MKVEAKLALCALKPDARSHIQLDQAQCAVCELRVCIRACPAHLYSVVPETGEVKVEHNGCLECGTCLVVCPNGALVWAFPEPGFGIRYRHG